MLFSCDGGRRSQCDKGPPKLTTPNSAEQRRRKLGEGNAHQTAFFPLPFPYSWREYLKSAMGTWRECSLEITNIHLGVSSHKQQLENKNNNVFRTPARVHLHTLRFADIKKKRKERKCLKKKKRSPFPIHYSKESSKTYSLYTRLFCEPRHTGAKYTKAHRHTLSNTDSQRARMEEMVCMCVSTVSEQHKKLHILLKRYAAQKEKKTERRGLT